MMCLGCIHYLSVFYILCNTCWFSFVAPCKFDFENGIDDWEKTGTVFDNQPTFGDNPTARKRGQPANQQGDWWIGGAENRSSKLMPAGGLQDDGPQGTLTSPYFKIIGNNISFLIGGGCYINTTRAELVIDKKVSFFFDSNDINNLNYDEGKKEVR